MENYIYMLDGNGKKINLKALKINHNTRDRYRQREEMRCKWISSFEETYRMQRVADPGLKETIGAQRQNYLKRK